MQEKPEKQFIIQLDGVNDHIFDAASHRQLNVAGLFDCSHGAGITPGEWPWVCDSRLYGYAGGLGPQNIESQLAVIESQRHGPGLPETPYWIDMEGRVRDEAEHLDLIKVSQVLQICAKVVR